MREGHPVSKRIEDWYPDGIPRKLELLIFWSDTPVHDAKEFSKMAQMSFDERAPAIKQTRPHCQECKINDRAVGRLEKRITDGHKPSV